MINVKINILEDYFNIFFTILYLDETICFDNIKRINRNEVSHSLLNNLIKKKLKLIFNR